MCSSDAQDNFNIKFDYHLGFASQIYLCFEYSGFASLFHLLLKGEHIFEVPFLNEQSQFISNPNFGHTVQKITFISHNLLDKIDMGRAQKNSVFYFHFCPYGSHKSRNPSMCFLDSRFLPSYFILRYFPLKAPFNFNLILHREGKYDVTRSFTLSLAIQRLL